jgi:polar amino acid transport system substrate-binding protein
MTITRIFAPLFCFLVLAAGTSCRGPESPSKEQRKAAVPPKKSRQVAAEAPAFPRGIIDAIKRRGELRVGMQVGYPPFQMLGNGGQFEGLDVDTAELAARALKVSLRVIRQNWSTLIPSLLAGETDVVMSGMTITPDRNAQAMFTIPVLETGRMFLVNRASAGRFRTIEDLNQAGIFVVSCPGGLGDLRPKELFPRAAYREFPDRTSALAEVLQGRAHAFVDEEVSIRLACATEPGSLVSSFNLLSREAVAWAVRPGDCHWLNWLNNFIRTMRRDGRIDSLKRKWLNNYFQEIRNRSTKVRKPHARSE